MDPIQGIFIYTGHFDELIDLKELNLDIVDPILVEITLYGYPFFKKISVIFLISASILFLEQIIWAR